MSVCYIQVDFQSFFYLAVIRQKIWDECLKFALMPHLSLFNPLGVTCPIEMNINKSLSNPSPGFEEARLIETFCQKMNDQLMYILYFMRGKNVKIWAFSQQDIVKYTSVKFVGKFKFDIKVRNTSITFLLGIEL